jgi:transcriptional regulator with XRE-family HTH domain
VIDASLFCARLKEERKRLGLSQAETAEKCGVKRETWSRYENGALTPGMEVLAALAAAGADVQYILTGVPSKARESEGDEKKQEQHGGLSPRKQAFLDLFDAIDEDQQDEVFRLACEKKRLKELEAENAALKKRSKVREG